MPFRRALEKLLPKLRQPLTTDPMPRIISRYLIPEFASSTLAALLKPHIESGLTPFAHDGSGVRAPDPSCWTGGLNKVRPLAEMCSTAQLRSICVSFFFQTRSREMRALLRGGRAFGRCLAVLVITVGATGDPQKGHYLPPQPGIESDIVWLSEHLFPAPHERLLFDHGYGCDTVCPIPRHAVCCTCMWPAST
jgi:hypothetical protein